MHLFRPFSQGKCCSNLASNSRVCPVPTLRRRHEKKAQSLAFVAVSLVCVMILAACNSAPTLRYITISPANQTIAVGTTQQFTATGYYSNGSVSPGITVSWSSSAVTSVRCTAIRSLLACPAQHPSPEPRSRLESGRNTLSSMCPVPSLRWTTPLLVGLVPSQP